MAVPMELHKIIISEMMEQQIIMLKEVDGERKFPIVIGSSEAMAIDRRLKGIPTPRPLTHDLLANIIESMGGNIEKIEINNLENHTFFAGSSSGRMGRCWRSIRVPRMRLHWGLRQWFRFSSRSMSWTKSLRTL
jgi:hypothetical protein